MPKVYGIHHTQLDSLSVAPYNVRTLFGINDGPLEIAIHFFFPIPIFSQKLPENGHWEKMTQLIKMIQIWCLSIESTSYPPRQCPKSLRQPPDTSQTPFRLPTDTTKYGTFWPIRGNFLYGWHCHWRIFPPKLVTFSQLLMVLIYQYIKDIFSCPQQLNRWPCHWLTHSLTDSLTHSLTVLLLLTYKERP